MEKNVVKIEVIVVVFMFIAEQIGRASCRERV